MNSTSHKLFQVSLIAKGLFAVIEIIGGLCVYTAIIVGNVFANIGVKEFLVSIANLATREELSEDPHDVIASNVVHWVQTFSLNGLHFAALYLIIHGVIKIWLIVGLLRKRLWYYPTALIVFSIFIIYQIYRYTFTHSTLLLLITAIDLIVILLTWYEYKSLN